jgi:hypothetical protein
LLERRPDLEGDIKRVGEALAATSPLALDEMPFAKAEALRTSFENCIAATISVVDPPSVFGVRVLRVARILGVLVLVGWLVIPYVRTHWMIHNVARGKPVTTSPLRGESPTADHLVDGKLRGTFDIATIESEHAFVQIDLEDVFSIDRVNVVNRGDGWYDDSLPLVLSVSTDGERFDDVARRDEHFDWWVIGLGGRPVRFVRLSKPDRGYIALNEVEVYGRK